MKLCKEHYRYNCGECEAKIKIPSRPDGVNPAAVPDMPEWFQKALSVLKP